MRRALAILVGVGFLSLSAGCEHWAGVCDCNPIPIGYMPPPIATPAPAVVKPEPIKEAPKPLPKTTSGETGR